MIKKYGVANIIGLSLHPWLQNSTMRQYKINFLNKYRRYCHACVYLRGGDICGFKLNDFYFQSRF